jgi:hypothetical protein
MGVMPGTATPLGKRVTVNTSADRLDTASSATSQRRSLLIRNRGSVAADIGASDVAAGSGFELAPGDVLAIDLAPQGSLWAVTASGSTTLHVLQVEWT